MDELLSIIGTSQILLGDDLKDRYNHIWKMNDGLIAKAVVLPKSTKELSEILKFCDKHKQTIVVHGGLTNLVGSTETTENDLVISLERMNKIEEIDEQSRTITVQAGVILQEVQEAAKAKDLLFPLNFGAKGSAQIGGVISTNAGGLRVFRFGMTRNLILGIEVVLADGTIISSLKKVIKDNSAYDLKQLFVGSEGTLGVVCKAVLKLVEQPKSRCSAYVSLNAYEQVVELLRYVDKHSAGLLSGFELIWGQTYKAMTTPPSKNAPPLPHGNNYYVLIELLGGDQIKDFALLQNILERALDNEIIVDAALAYTEADLEWFWQIREDVHVFVSLCTVDQHFDISLAINLIGDYVNDVTEKLKAKPEIEHVFPFGHVADGNIHFVIGKANNSEELKLWINDIVYAPLQDLMGSVSAEHGIGTHKKNYLSLCRSKDEIRLMKKIKKTLDPNNILNRGKVLDI